MSSAAMATHNDHPLPPPPQGGPQQHFPFQTQPSPSQEQGQHVYQQHWPQHQAQQQPQPQPDVFQQQQQYHQQHYQQQQPAYQQPQRQQSQAQYQAPAPAPAPVQAAKQPTRPAQGKGRPKSRAFSFRSDKSNKGGSLLETHAEKESNRLHSKADPTLAMNELEPATVAAGVRNSLASLRATTHKDSYGNPIVDPDASNPTRSRWERPLDTIRSFEAAIDGGSRGDRHSMIRSHTDSVANWNRRSSYYGGGGSSGNGNPRFPRDSYYGGGRPTSTMPTHSQYDLRQGTPGADSYYDNPGPYGQPGPGRQRYSRMGSEPHFNSSSRQHESSVYPMPMNHRSYETVASGTGSGASADPAGYQTDPTSSDNSSVERVPHAPPKPAPQPMNDYGIGFSQSQPQRPAAFTVGLNQSMVSPPPGAGAPPVPYKDARPNGHPVRQPSASTLQKRPDLGEKRKSWFSRRFSKNN